MVKTFLGALLLLSLTGCATAAPIENRDETSAAAVETAFFEAIAAGDGEAALALTTLTLDDFPCAEVITHREKLAIGLAAPAVGDVVVDGDTATVDFSYSMVLTTTAEKVTGSHTLVRDGDSWLIEWPESYRISATYPDEVVGEVALMGVTGGDSDRRECAAAMADRGSYELPALPGVYALVTSDPTGLFYSAEYASFTHVYDSAEPVAPTALEYLTKSDRDFAGSQIATLLGAYVDRCVASGLTSADCPDGIPAATGLVSTSDRLNAYDVEIYSEDNTTWRYRTTGESFLFERNGTIESYEMYYTGTVEHADTIYLRITVD